MLLHTDIQLGGHHQVYGEMIAEFVVKDLLKDFSQGGFALTCYSKLICSLFVVKHQQWPLHEIPRTESLQHAHQLHNFHTHLWRRFVT